MADARTDYVRSVLRAADAADAGALERGFADLERQARAWLTDQGIARGGQSTMRGLDMRYRGQGHEVTVPVAGSDFDSAALQGAVRDFHRLHERLYTHAAPDEPTEIVNLRVLGVGAIAKPRLAEVGAAPPGGEAAPPPERGSRELLFEGEAEFRRCTVFRRKELRRGMRLPGPAVVEQGRHHHHRLPRPAGRRGPVRQPGHHAGRMQRTPDIVAVNAGGGRWVNVR